MEGVTWHVMYLLGEKYLNHCLQVLKQFRSWWLMINVPVIKVRIAAPAECGDLLTLGNLHFSPFYLYQKECLVWLLYLSKVISNFWSASVLIQCCSLQLKRGFLIKYRRFLRLFLHNVWLVGLYASVGILQVSFFWVLIFINFGVLEESSKWILRPYWASRVMRTDGSPGGWLSGNCSTTPTSSFS